MLWPLGVAPVLKLMKYLKCSNARAEKRTNPNEQILGNLIFKAEGKEFIRNTEKK